MAPARAPQTRLYLAPISLADANAFVEKHHRHHGKRISHRFAVCVRGPRGGLRGAARALGYTRMFTYTMPQESGSSLRAIGMREDGMTSGRSWDTPGRRREIHYPCGPKVRWILEARTRDGELSVQSRVLSDSPPTNA